MNELVVVLWRGKFLVVAITALCLLAGAAAYFLVPRTYESTAEIYPLSQSRFSRYVELVGAEAFPYQPASLLQEFASYLRSSDLLFEAVRVSGVVPQGDMEEDEYRRAVLSFVRTISFEAPTERTPYLEIEVRAGDEEALNRFVSKALASASGMVSEGIRSEITQKLAAHTEQQIAEIEQARIEIEARREQESKQRQDRITILTDHAKIARALGLREPLEFQAIASDSAGSPASANVFSGNYPFFYRGYLAIEEEIELIKSRTNADPYIEDLRALEQKIYLLRNDPRPERVNRLLRESALATPEGANLVQYSLAFASAQRVFPRLIIFAVGALLLGMLLGSAVVLLRAGLSRQG